MRERGMKMSGILTDFTTEQLQAEIARRNEAMQIPRPLVMMAVLNNLPKLNRIIAEFIEFAASDDYHEDNDYDAYISEAAVMAFYGDSIWEWVQRER